MARPGDDGGGDEAADWDAGVGGTLEVLGEVKEVMWLSVLALRFSFRKSISWF